MLIMLFTLKKCYLLMIMALSVRMTKAVRVSEEKCQEYAQFVNEVEISPVLRMGTRKNIVSHCGIIETPLIIGGTKAKSKEFPHMVVVGFKKGIQERNSNKSEIDWDCGGSLISAYFVLTASHCLETDKGIPAVRVRAGSVNIKKPGPGHQERAVLERIKHPEYQKPSKNHDIGLIKLEKPFDLNGYVRPACLETLHELPDKSFIASGFGFTAYENEKGSDILLKVQLDHISKEVCESTWKDHIGTRKMPSGIIPNMLCAGVMAGGKDTCQGDSGGPLQRVLLEPNCMYSIVGVTSFGTACGFANTAAIYSKVSTYVDWIEAIVWPEN